MRVLAVNQFYAPDISATSQLLTQLCTDLVGQGLDVGVIASRARYLGGDKLGARERLEGVDVVRPWSSSLGKGRMVHRLTDYLSFWVGAVAQAAAIRRPDVILALSTPPMIAFGAALVAKARGIPLVTWVQDVYPDVAVAFGLFSEHHPASMALGALGRVAHGISCRSVVLSEGMARRVLAQGQRPERVRVIANWADGRAIRPVRSEDNSFRAAHDLQGRFVVLYSGNLGVGHDVATLIEAARLLEPSHPEVLLLFIGQGGRRQEAERLAAGCSNVRFLPYQPVETLAQSLSAGDVHVASLREDLAGLLVPSKLYGVMAAGRPLLYVGPEECEVARVVRDHDIGWTGRPGRAAELARAIARAATEPGWAEERG
ncbi:MAG: glycosyltransferase family 4 protein, partial [Deltaproteobacteria bacterium]|nr:glycosyltransferase family 4 protein [Deltaproteobacteria bacterium]MBW2536799.1 glycosyltransferase family 4 protein [Deltaproteobacteria bacterium]